MAAILEKYDSGETTISADNPSRELLYVISGTTSEAIARALLESTIPIVVGNLFLQNYTYQHIGGGVWEASAQYGLLEPKQPGDSSYSFTTAGGSQHITQSKEPISIFFDIGNYTPADFQGAIGVNGDSVEGTDITVPIFNFTETHQVPVALVIGAYKKKVFQLTGTVNDAPFKGFAKGEVLFLGASGSQRGAEAWEITYNFAASPNATGITMGDIEDIFKEGWHYLWVRYEDAEDEDKLIRQPRAVYTERVYDYGDFSQLGIGI